MRPEEARPQARLLPIEIHTPKWQYRIDLCVRPTLRRIDARGRIALPATWRRNHARGNKILVRTRGEVLELIPLNDIDLTAYFDVAEVDFTGDLADWHSVQRELRTR